MSFTDQEILDLFRLPERNERVENPCGMAQLRWRNDLLEQQWIITIYEGYDVTRFTEWRLVPTVLDS